MNNFKKILFILTLILCLNILIVNTVEAMSVNVMYWNDGGSYDNFYREIDQDESINLWYEVSISAINPSEELPVSVTLYREHNGDITYYNYDDGAQSYVLNNQQFSYIPLLLIL